MDRRSFITGIVGVLAAPAVIRTAGILMPVKQPILTPSWRGIFLKPGVYREGVDYAAGPDKTARFFVTYDHAMTWHYLSDVQLPA